MGKKAGKLGKLGPVVEKKVLPVETDSEKLVNYVCGSNINKQGQDIQLKPDSEYPEWLWSLRLGNISLVVELNCDNCSLFCSGHQVNLLSLKKWTKIV